MRQIFLVLSFLAWTLNCQAQQINGLALFKRVVDVSFILNDEDGHGHYDYNKAMLTFQCSETGDSVINVKVHHSLFPTSTVVIAVAKFQQHGITPMSITNTLQKEKLKNALLVMEVVLFREDDSPKATNKIPDIQSEKSYYSNLAKLLKQSNVLVLPPMIESLAIQH